MTQISLDDGTARDLLAAASANGMSVEAYVRARLFDSKTSSEPAVGRRSIIGLFADEADLLDEIVEEARRDRESRPWRTEDDHA